MLIISVNKNESLLALQNVSKDTVFVEADDNRAIKRLFDETNKYDINVSGKRLEVIIILESMTSLWLLQTTGVPEGINNIADILVTTQEDLMTKSVLVKLPGIRNLFPSLDRHTIDRNSDSTVHLVLFGLTPLAESLALNASLVAHYPNYCRDTRLRTRITIIDKDIFEARDRFIQRYAHLFENSWHRTINLQDTNPSSVVHKPMYEGKRKDFVDVEWEFVCGDLSNSALRQKLIEWTTLPQQLTIALCCDSDKQNIEDALSFPEEIYRANIPVLCHSENDELIRLAANDKLYSNIYTFNSKSCDINVLLRLRELGKRVNYVYNHCFSLAQDEPVTAPASIDVDKLESLWRKVGSLPKQYSNIFNAMTLGTKMHSIGHDPDDWNSYYALSKEEIDILTEVEHNRWSVEELILGYRPCTDEEQQLIENDVSKKKELRKQKIHYDLRSFDNLREDGTGKNVQIYDMALTQAIPLIMKSCTTD